MTRIRAILIIILLATGICAGVSLSAALVSVATAAEQARITLKDLDDTVQDAQYGLAALRTHEQELAGRVLDEGGVVDRLVEEQRGMQDVTRDARVTVSEVGQASIEQRHYWEVELPLLTTVVAETVRAARSAAASVPPVMKQARETLEGVGTVEQQAAQVARDVDARVASPEVTELLRGSMVLANQSAEAATHVNESAADAEAKLHSVLHPRWPGKLGRAIKHLF